MLLEAIQERNMSQSTEVQVINDQLLLDGIKEGESYVNEKNAAGLSDKLLFEVSPSAQNLLLSFKRIGRIENIIGFDKLTKLCLDNNFIEEIINLDALVSLRWLDLSFNKIRKIEGLTTLTQLEDLTLYANKISTIEGLDKCTSLQCLSLGNNRIDSLEQVIMLRQLVNLNMLTLSENPISKEAEYKAVVLAYVDNIKYLDYALVDPVERTTAKEQYHDELLDMEEKESVLVEKATREKALEQYLNELSKACVLFAHNIFDDLFKGDRDIERLKHLQGVKEKIEQFRSSFKSFAEEFIRNAMDRFKRKSKEIEQFERVVNKIREQDEKASTQLIKSFKASQARVAEQIITEKERTGSFHEDSRQVLVDMKDQLESVCDELMNIELRQVEKFDGLVDHFENRLDELKNEALEQQVVFFRQVEDMEEKFTNAIRGTISELIDAFSKEELAEDFLDDEAMTLVTDKENCMNLVSQSHDQHIGRLLKKEDEAKLLEINNFKTLVKNYVTEDNTRNRDRVLQIHAFSSETKASLQALISDEDEDGEYDL